MKKIINCLIISVFPILLIGQIPYGNNPETGKYIQTDDARIYYETYGNGAPLLLIHGSLYGYINEFESILPDLTKEFKVIAVALRGHGKSEIGDRNFSYKLFAEDIIQVLDNEQIDSVLVMGFSAGAITAIKLAAEYPLRIKRVVSIAGCLGVKDYKNSALTKRKEMTGEIFVARATEFVKSRKLLMPEPERFVEFYEKLKAVGDEPVWISDKKASQIIAPVLIVGGDRDEYFTVNGFNRMYDLIPNSELYILPKSGHVDALLNRDMYLRYAIPFLKNL